MADRPNQPLERTATRCTFTFCVAKTFSLRTTRALGGRRSSILVRCMKLFVVAAFMFFLGCASSSEHAEHVHAASLQRGFCLLHHVPLQQAVVYEFSPHRLATLDFEKEVYDLREKYPNCIPLGDQFTRELDWSRPVRAQYCPVCQHLYDDAAKKLWGKRRQTSNQTM